VISLDGLLRAEIALYLLECARVAGVIIVAPLAWLNAPNRVKVSLVLLLAFVAHGLSERAIVPGSMLEAGLDLATEFVVGLAMGFVVRIVFSAAEICGEILAPAIGLGVATAFDPSAHANQSIITSILRQLTILLALIVGIHRVLLGGLLMGFRLLPVGTASAPGRLLPEFVELSSLAISAGVRIALPLVAILYMTQIALAFIARAAPQMQVFNVGFAVMLAVGLFLLAIILPDISRSFLIELSQIATRLEAVLGGLGAVP
jgi:flagellar biosynthetic protein FliR